MIKNPVIQTILLVVILLAETTFLKNISFMDARPSIYFVFFIFIAYSQKDISGIVTGFFLGLAVDFISVSPLGVTSIGLSIIGFILGSLRGKIFVDPIFVPMLLAVVTSFIFSVISVFIFSLFSIETSVTIFSTRLLIQLFMNAIIAPVGYGLLRLSGIVPQYIREDNR